MSNRPSSGERRRRRVSYGGFGTLREGGVRRTRLEDESQLERHFVIGKVLGQGSFGIVKEATRYNESGMKYAIKIINKEKAAMRLLERELLILTLVEHPHIIRLEEVLETSKKMFLVLEFCQGGELQDLFRARGHFSEEVRPLHAFFHCFSCPPLSSVLLLAGGEDNHTPADGRCGLHAPA
eukprot:m.40351 g.40351  ORF g.40351 m.40351 type:complete len:181 (+) comp32960_c0_seq1:203-745(+)